MSAPKPELTAELRAVMERFFITEKVRKEYEPLVREVVEIVARKDAELAMDADTNYDAEQAILSNWKLERKP